VEDEDTQHSIAYYCSYLFTSMESSVRQSLLLVAHCVHAVTMTLILTSLFFYVFSPYSTQTKIRHKNVVGCC